MGDRITLTGDIYPGEWEFNIRGIYTATNNAFDMQTFFFHWSLLDDRMTDTRKSQDRRDRDEGERSDGVGAGGERGRRAVRQLGVGDAHRERKKAFQQSFISMSSAVVGAIRVISLVVLVILGLILANTLAMATRERTTEYAVMRAIGFRPWHIVAFVIGEGFVVAATGVGMAWRWRRRCSSFLPSCFSGSWARSSASSTSIPS